MEIRCCVCDELLVKLIAKSQGQVVHCQTTQRYDGETVWLHDSQFYNPLRIWSDVKMDAMEKDRQLRLLARLLVDLEREYRYLILDNLKRVRKYQALSSQTLLNAVVADSYAESKSAFDGVRVRWKDKGGVNKLWKSMLVMWANSNTELTYEEIEDQLRTVNAAVRFARRYKIEVPPHLEKLK